MTVREKYLQYLKQGLPPKEAAKMVQATTGMSARTGKPLKKPQESTELYNDKRKGYIGQYG